MQEVTVDLGDGMAGGAFLNVPENATGMVLFAHGSGSSRHSPRNRFVADVLAAGGIGTLLLDLLTPQEERLDAVTAQLRFDIELLATRLSGATRWARERPELKALQYGYFGASTGAGAALVAAAAQGDAIAAVVSRGGRPDLAGERLREVRAPTLLIVGSEDRTVLDLNRRAAAMMCARHELAIVPGATHLFEEAGALEEVARFARDWFARYLLSSSVT